jgi:hypothetical protein
MSAQLDLLSLVANDHIHKRDRRLAEMAIRADAAAHGGHVCPNRVRAALSNTHGLDVYPRVLSATYSALRRAGVIVPDGWTVNTDRAGGNAGKPARLWKLVSE